MYKPKEREEIRFASCKSLSSVDEGPRPRMPAGPNHGDAGEEKLLKTVRGKSGRRVMLGGDGSK